MTRNEKLIRYENLVHKKKRNEAIHQAIEALHRVQELGVDITSFWHQVESQIIRKSSPCG